MNLEDSLYWLPCCDHHKVIIKTLHSHHCSFLIYKLKPSKGMSTRVYGAGVVIFEGIMTLHHKKVVDLLHLKLFVDTDADIRLARRLKRDISERGRGLEDVFNQYDTHVKPGYQKYIGPSISNADIVIPRGRDNLGTVQNDRVHSLWTIDHGHKVLNDLKLQ